MDLPRPNDKNLIKIKKFQAISDMDPHNGPT